MPGTIETDKTALIGAASDGVRALLALRGQDVQSDGLRATPDRVVKAFLEMTAGYYQDPAEILARRFVCESDSLILLRDISFVSLCEHHLMPFSGVAHVGYIPSARSVVGLSKLARLVHCFAKRLQLQERLTAQIANALELHLRPDGIGVVLQASHACMACRGVGIANAAMITSSLKGALRDEPEARAEFFALIK